MKTEQAKTFEILSGYLMNNNELNVDYFADLIYIYGMNHENAYNLTKGRCKPFSVAVQWLVGFVNEELTFAGYKGYTCTNAQLMKFDKEHGDSLTKALKSVEKWVAVYREELKQYE